MLQVRDPGHIYCADIVSSCINFTVFSFEMLSNNKKIALYLGVMLLLVSKVSTIDSQNIRY